MISVCSCEISFRKQDGCLRRQFAVRMNENLTDSRLQTGNNVETITTVKLIKMQTFYELERSVSCVSCYSITYMRSCGGSLAPTANVYIFLSRRVGLLQWQLFVFENYVVTVTKCVGLTCIDKIINVYKFTMLKCESHSLISCHWW